MAEPTPTPEPKLTPYQEGYERGRSEAAGAGNPEVPDGYRRGRIYGAAFVHLPATVCESCGAVVGDAALHDAWHLSLAATARTAYMADVMTNVIGPKP